MGSSPTEPEVELYNRLGRLIHGQTRPSERRDAGGLTAQHLEQRDVDQQAEDEVKESQQHRPAPLTPAPGASAGAGSWPPATAKALRGGARPAQPSGRVR